MLTSLSVLSFCADERSSFFVRAVSRLVYSENRTSLAFLFYYTWLSTLALRCISLQEEAGLRDLDRLVLGLYPTTATEPVIFLVVGGLGGIQLSKRLSAGVGV